MIKIEELIYNYIHTFCDFEKQLILTNHFHTDWEADLLLVDEQGVSHEIEIKFSKSDFRNDFKKSFFKKSNKFSKSVSFININICFI